MKKQTEMNPKKLALKKFQGKCGKAVAVFLSLSIVFTPGVSFAGRGEQAALLPKSFVPEFAASLPLELKTANLREALSGFGTVDEVYFSKNEKHPAVYLVQDAHASLEAQKNISKILSLLNERDQAQTVFLEGAIDTVDPDLLRFFKDESRNHQLARLFLKNGLIGGTEIFLLEHSRTAVPVEDVSLYSKSLELYRSVLAQDERTSRYLSSLKVNISSVNAGVFNKELAGYFREWLFYEMGEARPIHRIESLAKYAREVLGIDLNQSREQEAWPQLVRILKIKDVEKELNPGAVKIEKTKLALWAKDHGISESLSAALNLGGNSPIESAGADFRKAAEVFYEAARQKGFSYSDYPAFSKSLAFEILRSELDGARLFEEMDRVNGLILERLAKEKSEKELIGIYRDYTLMKKLMTLSATDEDYERILKNKKAVSPESLAARIRAIAAKSENSGNVKEIAGKENRLAESIYAEAFKFYALAKAREKKIFENMTKRLAENGHKNAVLVSGGFHTGGLKKMMRENHLTYAVITPRISEINDDSAYESVMALRGDYGVKQSYIKQATAANPLFQLAQTLGRPVAEHYAGMTNAALATIMLDEGLSLQELVGQVNEFAGRKHSNGEAFYRLVRPELAVMNDLFASAVSIGISNRGPVVIPQGEAAQVAPAQGEARSEMRILKPAQEPETVEAIRAKESLRARVVKKTAAVSMSVLTLLNVVTPAAKTTLIAGGFAVCGQGCGVFSQSYFNQLDLNRHIRTVLLAGQNIVSIRPILTHSRDLVAAQVQVGESIDAEYLTVVYSTKRDKDGNPVELLSIAGDIRSIPKISRFDDTGHIFIHRSHDSYQDLNDSTADKVAIYGFRDEAASANGVVDLSVPPDAELKIQDYRGGRLSASFYPNVGASAGGTRIELNASPRGVVSVVSVNYHYLPTEIISTLPHAASNPNIVFEEREYESSLARSTIQQIFTTEGQYIRGVITDSVTLDGTAAVTTLGKLDVSPDGSYLLHASVFRLGGPGTSVTESQEIKISDLLTGSVVATISNDRIPFDNAIVSIEFINDREFSVHFENGWETHYNIYGDEIALVELAVDKTLTTADITSLPLEQFDPRAITEAGEFLEPAFTEYGIRAEIAYDSPVNMEGFGLHAKTMINLYEYLNEDGELILNLKKEGRIIPLSTQLTLEFGNQSYRDERGVWHHPKKSMDIMTILDAGDNLVRITKADIERGLRDQGINPAEITSIYLMAWHEKGMRRFPVSLDLELQVVAHTEIPANAIPSPDGNYYAVEEEGALIAFDRQGTEIGRITFNPATSELVDFSVTNHGVSYTLRDLNNGNERTRYRIYSDFSRPLIARLESENHLVHSVRAGETIQRPGSNVQVAYIIDYATGQESEVSITDHPSNYAITADERYLVHSFYVPADAQSALPRSGFIIYDIANGTKRTLRFEDTRQVVSVNLVDSRTAELEILNHQTSTTEVVRYNLETGAIMPLGIVSPNGSYSASLEQGSFVIRNPQGVETSRVVAAAGPEVSINLNINVTDYGIYYMVNQRNNPSFKFVPVINGVANDSVSVVLPEGIHFWNSEAFTFPFPGQPVVDIVAPNLQTYRINLQLEMGEIIGRYSVDLEGDYLVVRDFNGEEIGSIRVGGLRDFAVGNSAIYYVSESRNNYSVYTNAIDAQTGLGETEYIRINGGVRNGITFANHEIPVIRYEGNDRVLRFVNLDTGESVLPTSPNGIYSVANIYNAPGTGLIVSENGIEAARVSLPNTVGNYMVTNDGIFAATNLPNELLFIPFNDLNQVQAITLPDGLLPASGISTEFPLAFASPDKIAPIAEVPVIVNGAYERYTFDLSANPATLVDTASRSELRNTETYFADRGASFEAVVDTAKYAAAETVAEEHRANEAIYRAILDAVAPEIVKEAAVPGLSNEMVRDLVNARIATLPQALAVKGLVMDGKGAAVLSTESRPADTKKRTSLILAALPFLVKLAAKDSRGNFLPSFIFTGEKSKVDGLRHAVLEKASGLDTVERNQVSRLISYAGQAETAGAISRQTKSGRGVTLSLTPEELQKMPAEVQNILNAIEDLSELEGVTSAEALVEKAEAYAVRAHLLTKLAAMVRAELLKQNSDVPKLVRDFFAQNLPDVQIHLDGSSFRLSLSDVAAQLAIFRQAAEKMAASA